MLCARSAAARGHALVANRTLALSRSPARPRPSSSSLFRARAAAATMSAEQATAAATTTTTVAEDYAAAAAKLRDISRLGEISGILGWDELTFQPPGAAAARAAQKETLEGIAHDKQTDPALGILLERLAAAAAEGSDLGAPDPETADVRRAVVRLAVDDYRREVRVPKALAQKMAKLESEGYHAWAKARSDKDWAAFAPYLKQWLDALKEKAAAIDASADPYTVLLHSFDRGSTRARLDQIFGELKEGLVPLLKDLRAARAALLEKKANGETLPPMLASAADASWLLSTPDSNTGKGGYDLKAQEELCRELVLDMGFDMEHGRIDTSVHPFTGGAGPTDVRLTTRFKAEDAVDALSGAIHEAGHGLYEQGRNVGAEWDGLPVGRDAGMSCHESQSLLWERMVALTPEYSRYLLPKLAKSFPDSAFAAAAKESDGAERLYAALNALKLPSHVRVEADEVHYPLHVLLRFELEKDMIDGKLSVDDVPAAWNAKCEEYLGEAPPHDGLGALQDVHWSGGAIGYFGSYTLGAMMAVQFFDAAEKEIPDLRGQISRGEFKTLRQWLKDKIHSRGSFYPSADALLEAVTGKPLDVKIFLKYLSDKYRPLYGI